MKAFDADSLRAEKKQRATVSSIPQEIQEEILLKLPVKSILCFKSACKSWCTLLSSPKFVNDHLILNKQKPRLMVTDLSYREDIFYSIDYGSNSASDSLWSTPCKFEGSVVMDDPVKELNGEIEIFGSYVYAYTLGLDSWRKLNPIPDKFHSGIGLLLNGAIHWSDVKAIVAFDLSNEKPFPEEVKALPN
ncbi:putative F-box protein At3g47150 [Papaver somniferum]|uniref:putative F-box protein At3g47150 n=1 Tax=Papaver somniferum TaxID=3469 RepID=UPI000E703478|nr:putative F-box protein At3g47150 [Papaver somniferum]